MTRIHRLNLAMLYYFAGQWCVHLLAHEPAESPWLNVAIGLAWVLFWISAAVLVLEWLWSVVSRCLMRKPAR